MAGDSPLYLKPITFPISSSSRIKMNVPTLLNNYMMVSFQRKSLQANNLFNYLAFVCQESHNIQLECSDTGHFWARSVEILVFASPTGYMLTSSGGFPLLNWGNPFPHKMISSLPAVLKINGLFIKLN